MIYMMKFEKNSSSVQDYFRFSENPVYQRMDSFMQKYNTDTSKAGAKKVVNGYAADFYRNCYLMCFVVEFLLHLMCRFLFKDFY